MIVRYANHTSLAAVSDSSLAIVLRRSPRGLPEESDFAMVEQPLGEAGDVLVAVEWLAMDPYLRVQLAGRHLAPPIKEGEVIPGQGVGRVVASRLPERFPVGSWVVGALGWRERGWLFADAILPFRFPEEVPLPARLGALGMPGLTAWAG